ncbi:MAG TPA: hypothetical protein VFK69_04345, partial [Candidatus Eisenbacteria bacterium]|nr:hypothetical protein [Candidatus Eisenbacteria bacterium]
GAADGKPWRAAASSVPKLPAFAGGHQAEPGPARVTADDDEATPMRDLPDDVRSPIPAGGTSRPHGKGSPATVLPPLAEPWWMVAADAVRTQRRAQVIAAAVVLGAIGLVIMLQQAPQGTPLSHIRREPAAWDGRTVTVSGRVDQAFPLAGGWAFFLVQGRDTMVTFTRSRTPVPGERVVVTGQINTGFLDGIPRQALFEQAPKPTN